MNKFIGLIALAIVALGATSCQFRQDQDIDFLDLTAAQGLSFRVISQHETDLSDGIPNNCYLPDGTPESDD
jgi:hypothetical protein